MEKAVKYIQNSDLWRKIFGKGMNKDIAQSISAEITDRIPLKEFKKIRVVSK